MKIVLVRHGETTGNQDKTFTGWSDVRLTDRGKEALKSYKESYHYPKTDRYYTSDLTRTIETFDILFGDDAEIYESSKELREIYFGDIEDEPQSVHVEAFAQSWGQNIREHNWETVSEFTYRIVSKLEAILKDLKDKKLDSATIVCHSGVIKTLIIFLTHQPYMDFTKIKAPNGLGYILDLSYDEKTGKIFVNNYEAISKK